MTYISIKEMTSLITATVRNWQEDRAPRLGAALAFYMALSLAPTVVITLAIAGFMFSAKAAQGELVSEIQGMVGYEGAKVIQAMMIKGAHRPSSGIAATILAVVTLLFSSTSVISELKDALNTIWKVPEDRTSSHVRSMFNLVRERLLCLALVLGAGLFLLASLILHASISAVNKYLLVATPPQAFIRTADWAVSFLVVTVLFAFLFKVLPHVRLQWSDVTLGAILTSLLFTAGKLLLGLYLGKAGFADAYGAAGSLMILLMWVYYSAQVLYLGAEFTRVYTLRFGSRFAATLDPIASRPEVVLLP